MRLKRAEENLQRIERDVACVALAGAVPGDLCRQVFATRGPGTVFRTLAGRFDVERSVAQVEPSDLEIEQRLDRRLIAGDLRLRQIGSAVGLHDEVNARPVHRDVFNRYFAGKERNDAQLRVDAVDAQQRGDAGRLAAMHHETVRFDRYRVPVPAEGAELYPAAGDLLGQGDHFAKHAFAEPVALRDPPERARRGREKDCRRRPGRRARTSSWLEFLFEVLNLRAPALVFEPGIHVRVGALKGDGSPGSADGNRRH